MKTFNDPLPFKFWLIDNGLTHILAKQLEPGGLGQRQVLNNSQEDRNWKPDTNELRLREHLDIFCFNQPSKCLFFILHNSFFFANSLLL